MLAGVAPCTFTMCSWQIRSSSSVLTPGFTYGATICSTSAASRPATRIFSISSGLFRLIDIQALSPKARNRTCGLHRDVRESYNSPVAVPGPPWRSRPRRGVTGEYTPVATARAGVPPQAGNSRRFGHGSDGEAQPRNPLPAFAPADRPYPFRRPGSTSRSSSNAPDHHAPDAGGRRSFRPPDPLLEPEDGSLHLRRARQDPHHQPRKDHAAVRRRDELHVVDRPEARHRAVRGYQAQRPRGREG